MLIQTNSIQETKNGGQIVNSCGIGQHIKDGLVQIGEGIKNIYK